MSHKKRKPTARSQLARVVRENPMFRVRCLSESSDNKKYSRKTKHKKAYSKKA